MTGGLSTTAALLGPTDLDIATRTLWGECRGESREGQIAVAWVIRNRAERPGWWGHTVSGVCLAPRQFSCWNPGDPNRDKLKALPVDDPAYQALYQVACDVMLGTTPDPTGHATHYEVTGTDAAWARGRTPSAVIGRHSFYALGLGA